jgi:phosphoglucosamine mutase
MPEVKSAIERVESALGDEGRVLVRYSGTELKARIMVEGPDAQAVRKDAEAIAKAFESAQGALV